MDKKYFLIVIFVVIFIMLSCFFTGKNSKVEDNYLKGTFKVQIKVKEYGTIDLELDANQAPITVTNFIDLVQSKYYDGLKFHRIIDGFMMQGGAGETKKTIKGEFSNNGIENNISHIRGTISMARSNDYDSASTQFFIVQSDSTYLDGNYAAFGKVTNGLDIVDKICKFAIATDDNGTISEENQPIIEYIKVIE